MHRLVQTKIDGVGLISHLTFKDRQQPAPAKHTLHCALLADPHISADPGQTHGAFHVGRNFAAIVAEVAVAKPDVALIAGDIAWQQGLPGDYEHFHSLIQPLVESTPVCLTLGNHDDRLHFLSALGPPYAADDVPEHSIVIVEGKPVRIILLDSLFRNDLVPGFLGKAQRDWLDGFLAEDAGPTILVVHHPLDDRDTCLLDAARLLCLLRRHRHVKAVFHGHDHAYRYGACADLPIIGLPAIGMPLEEGQPLGWMEARFGETKANLSFRVTHAGRGTAATLHRELEWRA